MAEDHGDPGELPATSPRPGPDALYGSNPTPPPLENGPGWEADPLLVCGAAAYDDGEYLYQDFIFDDHGADQRSVLSRAPANTRSAYGSFSPATGDLFYPNDHHRYAYNAADLLEFRARIDESGGEDEIVYRFTLNSMAEPDLAGIALGIDTTASGGPVDGTSDWGYGLGDLGAPADHVLVTWGTGAELDGERLDDDRVSVDVERNQIEVQVPLDPGTGTWRHYLGVGLWDPENDRFKQPRESPTDDLPGGARPSSNPPPIFNVGFRFDEPIQEEELNLIGLSQALRSVLTGGLPRFFTGTIGRLSPIPGTESMLDEITAALDGELPRTIGRGNWREYGQARALAERDISAFFANIDFAKMRQGLDDSRVPKTGYLTMLYPSRYDYGRQGTDPYNDVFWGRLQPYGVYVPPEHDPEEPAPMTLMLHSLGCNYNEYSVFMPGLVESIAKEQDGIVLMPQARGPGRWYRKEGEVDVFEAWRDLETRYEIDRDRVTVAGYSMGGFGTQILSAKYPDLFGRGFSVVAPPSEDPLEGPSGGLIRSPTLLTQGLLGGRGGGEFLTLFTTHQENAMDLADNLRHIPMLLWNGGVDELVPVLGPINYSRKLKDLGYRHQLDVFPAAGHLMLAVRDKWNRAPEFLARGYVKRGPTRVTYRRDPEFDEPALGLAHDKAYWVSDIRVRDTDEGGLVDAHSLAEGYDKAVPESFRETGSDPQTRISKGTKWVDFEHVHDEANELHVKVENVDGVTLWIEEAGLEVDEELRLIVRSDGLATLTLAGSFGRETVEVVEGDTTIDLGPLTDPSPEDAGAVERPGEAD
ncbi:PHB depolymerase family esterase [Haloglomus litoreum]|uniref:PHB depolymerase family esterase n=1 Tax=Haloglomus litoreum TaxID=3034026 RepID=UPI0023E89605|nr:PHB depolymerase family esterase [Haloglomus sp. DT116]